MCMLFYSMLHRTFSEPWIIMSSWGLFTSSTIIEEKAFAYIPSMLSNDSSERFCLKNISCTIYTIWFAPPLQLMHGLCLFTMTFLTISLDSWKPTVLLYTKLSAISMFIYSYWLLWSKFNFLIAKVTLKSSRFLWIESYGNYYVNIIYIIIDCYGVNLIF